MESPDRLRVLVVDDQPDIVELLSDVLTMLGNDCRVARTGGEALTVVEVFAPDVILLDIGLPDMSGYAVSLELRRRGVRAYIAAVTGWGQEEDRSRSLAAGMDEHLLKPATIDKIKAALVAARAANR